MKGEKKRKTKKNKKQNRRSRLYPPTPELYSNPLDDNL